METWARLTEDSQVSRPVCDWCVTPRHSGTWEQRPFLVPATTAISIWSNTRHEALDSSFTALDE